MRSDWSEVQGCGGYQLKAKRKDYYTKQLPRPKRNGRNGAISRLTTPQKALLKLHNIAEKTITTIAKKSYNINMEKQNDVDPEAMNWRARGEPVKRQGASEVDPSAAETDRARQQSSCTLKIFIWW